MIKFKLHDIFVGGIDRIVMCSGSKPGTETNKRMTFLPGVEYTVSDPIVIKYIKGEIGDVREKMVATASLKAELAAAGIEYETKRCGTCTASKPKALFNPFVILEDDGNE